MQTKKIRVRVWKWIVLLAAGLLAGPVISRSEALPLIGTNVSVPSSGCVFVGLEGRYITDTQAAINRINEIRLEACREGVQNPSTGQPLTEADYVEIRWSYDLEYIARIRAAESAITMNHARLNGGSIWLSGPSGVRSYGEVLAWNWGTSMVRGIEQWYGEKTDWVGNTGGVTEHYESMIDPSNRYVGLATFCSDSGTYYNCTAGEFSSRTGLDETPVNFSGDCIQVLEVKEEYISQDLELSGTNRGVKGDKASWTLSVNVLYSGRTAEGLHILEAVTWSSSEETVVSVDTKGNVEALSCGQAVITGKWGEDRSASGTFTVNHIPESVPGKEANCTETGLTEGSKCSACGEILKAQEVIPATGHAPVADVAVAATCTETGLTEGSHCSVCSTVLTAQEIIPATGHAPVVDASVAPTCTEAGLTEGSHCSVCNSVLTVQEVIHANGHASEVLPAKPATCTETGLTEGSKCPVCGVVIKKQEKIQPLGHSWDNGRVTKEATYEAGGEITYTCMNDSSHTRTEAIPKLQKTEAQLKDEADAAAAETAGIVLMALKASDSVTMDDQVAVEEARKVYESLTEDQKKKLPAETLKKLTDAESKINSLVQKAAEEAEAREAAEKAEAEAKAVAEKAESAAGKIAEVPDTDELTVENEAAIEEAAAAYEALAETEKALVPEETVRKLQEAQAKIAVLKAEAADPSSAKSVETSLTKLADNSDPAGSSFAPLKAKLSKATKNTLKITWTKVKGAKGYIIYANACGKNNRMKKVATVKTNKYTLKKVAGTALKKGIYYKIFVAAYKTEDGYDKTIAKSKVIHACTTGGKVTNPKKVTVNAKSATIKKGKKYTIKAKQVSANTKLTLKKHRALSYESSNTKVVTVTKKGVVKGVKKGKATIYVYAQNGVYATVSVRVK